MQTRCVVFKEEGLKSWLSKCRTEIKMQQDHSKKAQQERSKRKHGGKGRYEGMLGSECVTCGGREGEKTSAGAGPNI